MNEDRALLLRFLAGELTPPEAQEVQSRLQHESALRTQHDRLLRLQQTLQADTPASFGPYFSERVLRKLSKESPIPTGETLYESLWWVFARAAVASLIVAGVLGAYNIVDYQNLGVVSSWVEALFGLPSASLVDALSYGAL